VVSLRKVSQFCRDLVERGLLGVDEARRVALVAELMPAVAGAVPMVSVEALTRAAGLPAEVLPRHIGHLRSLGITVEQVGTIGYRLACPCDDSLVPEAFLPLLLQRMDNTLPPAIGLPYRYLAHCPSTNLELKNEAAALGSGTLVVTDDQTEGRGRLGRSWSSRPGEDLTFSVLLRPGTSSAEASLLSLAAALATAEVLETLPGLEGRVGVKWPNDVLIDEKKVCGILLESSLDGQRLDWVVAGIGLNVNSDPGCMLEELTPVEKEAWRGRPRPTSLRVELGRRLARGPLLTALLARLSVRWTDTAASDLLVGLRARDALLGCQLQVFAGPPDGALVVAGEAIGIGSQGELLVRDCEGTTVPVFAGEVTLRVDRSAG
jgi:BirA family biotin operon repressor/biotin-[acetyl-CoA-carboxylase] ligase